MNNKKLMISLFSLCLVAIVGLLTTVIVLAAGQGTVQSNFTVKYVATNISGKVKGNYTVGSTTKYLYADASKTSATNGDEIEFKADDKSVSFNLVPAENVVLTADDNYVIFEYTFTNTGDAYTVKVSSSFTDSNLKVTYGTSKASVEDTTVPTVEVAANGTSNYYVKIALVSSSVSTEVSGAFTFTMAKK